MNEDRMYEKADLLRMTREPLDDQYQRIVAKIMEAIDMTEGEKCVWLFP